MMRWRGALFWKQGTWRYLRTWQQLPLKAHGKKNSPKGKKGEKKGDNSEGKGKKQMVSNVLIFIFS